jgi:uncharacterized protein (DUF433 family)
MGQIDWQERIEAHPEIHHGEPVVKGTRVPVVTIVGSLADGMTAEEICAAFPQLTPADVQAALAYAADVMRREVLLPFAAPRMSQYEEADLL